MGFVRLILSAKGAHVSERFFHLADPQNTRA